MRYLLVEGITDVALVKYICLKNGITKNFNDFDKQYDVKGLSLYQFNNLNIIDLKGQDRLKYGLDMIKPDIKRIKKIGIIQDADNNYITSYENIKKAIKTSKIDDSNIKIFLTPNDKDIGDLETLLISTIKDKSIIKCFQPYKECLEKDNNIHEKALNKGEVYAYTMYSQSGENLHKPEKSFIYKKDNNEVDTNLWDIEHENFTPIVDFVKMIFKS